MKSAKALVDRGLEVKAAIATLTKELKEIEADLHELGLNGDHKELKDPKREGRRWLATGSNKIVSVVFTADKLIQTFQKGSVAHQNIEMVAGDKFLRFFKPVESFKSNFENGLKFRNQADAILGDRAPMFITACLSKDSDGIPKSDVKVDWDKAKPKREAM